MARQRRQRGQRHKNKDNRAPGNGPPTPTVQIDPAAALANPCPVPLAPSPGPNPGAPSTGPAVPALVREVAEPKCVDAESKGQASMADPTSSTATAAVAQLAERQRPPVVVAPPVQMGRGLGAATGGPKMEGASRPRRPPVPPRGGGGGGGGRGNRGRGRGGRRVSEDGDRGERDAEDTWLERVRRQVDFYFSDANLRRDKFLLRKIEEGKGFVPLSTLLQFNKIRALRCRYPAQLVQAIRKSDMLSLSEDKSRVQRDFLKAPRRDADPVPRTIYVEGLPLALGIDELTNFFSRHGRVCFIELPRHRDTREPRGFCFVEFSADSEALAAVSTLDSVWPSMWGARYDGKVLKAMTKRRWLERREEYRELQRERGGGHRPAVTTVPPGETEAPDGAEESAPASSSTAPAPNVSMPSADGQTAQRVSRVREQPGCLLRMSGFSQIQTAISLRQFVEHAVPVEYCDLPQADSLVAVLRLRCPEDCQVLLEDVRQTRRLLGWEQPDLHVLSPEEELEYWRAADERRAAQRASAPVTQSTDGTEHASAASEQAGEAGAETGMRERRRHRSLSGAQASVDTGGTTSIRRWPLRAGSGAHTQRRGQSQPSGCFVDTVCGNARFTAPGFGRSKRGRRRWAAASAKRRPQVEMAAMSLKRSAAAVGPAAGEPPAKLPALEPLLLPVPVPLCVPLCATGVAAAAGSGAPALASAARPGAPLAAAALILPPAGAGAAAATAMPPPASPPPPSGAKPKRKPPPRVPPPGPPRTPVPRPPPSAMAQTLIPPPSPVPCHPQPQPRPISSPGKGERLRRTGERPAADPRLPPPSPVALPPLEAARAGQAAAGSSTAPMPVAGPLLDSNAGQGKDSMLADTDDILGLMDD